MRFSGTKKLAVISFLVLGVAACGPATPQESTTPEPAPERRAETRPAAPPPPAANTAGSCKTLFTKATGKFSQDKISCIEDGFEKRDHDFDADACNKLENAWAVGSGDTNAMWSACQAAEKFDDDDCSAVLTKCF